jgi:hypothetical protein
MKAAKDAMRAMMDDLMGSNRFVFQLLVQNFIKSHALKDPACFGGRFEGKL